MSKLAALLQSRGMQLATPATPATPEAESSSNSRSSRVVEAESGFSPALEQRIRSMAKRWRYSAPELAEVLALARADAEKWTLAVSLDEWLEQRFRNSGFLPRADA